MPYFGKWPDWIDLYFESCRWNSSINWIFFTDCGLPENRPGNVKFIDMSLRDVAALCNRKFDLKSNIALEESYKLCDLRPMYGHIFQEYAEGYDYFGFGDIDLVYGRIRNFLNDDVLTHDLISCHGDFISGHFCLIKNCEEMIYKYREIDKWKETIMCKTYQCLEELAFFKYIDRNKCWIKEMYTTPTQFVSSDDRSFNFPGEWYWRDGMVTNNKYPGKEYIYFHWLAWKRPMIFHLSKSDSFFSKKLRMLEYLLRGFKMHLRWEEGIDGFRINRHGFFKTK